MAAVDEQALGRPVDHPVRASMALANVSPFAAPAAAPAPQVSLKVGSAGGCGCGQAHGSGGKCS